MTRSFAADQHSRRRGKGDPQGLDRLRNAMTQDSDQLGVIICYEGIYTRDHLDDVTDMPWWAWHGPDMDMRQEVFQRYVARHDLDCFVLRDGPTHDDRANLRIEGDGDRAWIINRTTGAREELVRPPVGGVAVPPFNDQALDRSGFDTMLGPDPDPEQFFGGRGTGAWEFSDWQRQEFPDIYLLDGVLSPLWQLTQYFGFEGAMTVPLEDPDLTRHALRRLTARQIARLPAIAARGAHGVWIEECFTDMHSPTLFAQLNVPLVAEMVSAIHDNGMQAIYYYCGNPCDRWQLLKATGADAIHVEESKKDFRIDVADASEALGPDVCLFGNLDAIGLLEQGSDDDLRREVQRQMDVGRARQGRFVLSIGSPVTPATSVQRVRRYAALAHEYGS